MNKKENILDAWITIEQLSEGSIDKADKNLKRIFDKPDDWHEFFLDFLQEQIKKSDLKKNEEPGIVMYFDIFNFQEIIDILRKSYNVEATDEETSLSSKFTYCLYFDKELHFLADKFFYTMSGYIRLQEKFPENFLEIEADFCEALNQKLEDKGFNNTITELLQNEHADMKNFRYKFIRNLENDEVNLHSFFIEDLQQAKKTKTDIISYYFKELSEEKVNLDSNRESKNFNPAVFERILQPKNYPLGRFPSNSEHALSFMQQTAVNVALKEDNKIGSVNGPPGTGKTTLLKDIFAELIVKQAKEICSLEEKQIEGSVPYWENAKLGVLSKSISNKNIIVASTNNGAVQNIVEELPKQKEISNEFIDDLIDADYFFENSNKKLKLEFPEENGKKTRKIVSESLANKNWGTFSLEGGAKSKINNLLLTLEVNENHLKYEYQPNPKVYEEFMNLYKQLEEERSNIQRYSEKVQKIIKLTHLYDEKKLELEQCKEINKKELALLEKKVTEDINLLNEHNNKVKKDKLGLSKRIQLLTNEEEQAERNFIIIKEQRPSFMFFQKIFNRNKTNEYVDKLSYANEELNKIKDLKIELMTNEANLTEELLKNRNKVDQHKKELVEKTRKLEQQLQNKQTEVDKLEKEKRLLEEEKSKSDISELDFSQSYSKLQLSNPWFNERFRILQSKLFILSLKVRKQFLYENVKHVSAARNIWLRQSSYKSKENGDQILEESWQWINFAIPVISTTFASFGRMFKHLNENSISNVFIDEAGQALPQASVGSMFRSKRILAVGDPSQIKPVMVLDSKLLTLVSEHHNVDETFLSSSSSTQSLVDGASKYGYQKNEEEWIGIPLWVHRRSDYPMFTISNAISYDNLMVQGKEEEEAYGYSEWFHVSGKANDKFVKEQATLLIDKINDRLQKNPELKDEIYVISPFRNVALELAKQLDGISFTKRTKGKVTNIGTVHTFQGKEADIVYFVLGADTSSEGAATWAVDEPNMMNVAATRAKKEFYIIGDKRLYASLGSKVVNQTIKTIDAYNK